ncbi:hypothetical protein [Myxococcus sp. RHSTA-1-4]|uniref:hypothetical protein n=1 Tax=Myxococcus sp. RHSTA-1-4 TaxID=2874601 RepID=UPI001CBD93E5|nr:hypothetical protein [Myxococcus sp. RHSTA-1-4]MBZ4421333.1 hypothetical protein [Myxococcus sp. RHSTA-1-4]
METFRPLLPVGYAAGAEAYRRAAEGLTADELTQHYTRGLRFFHEELVPRVKARLSALSGGVWRFDDYVAFAAGSDCDFMSHLVEAVAAREPVRLYPGDWHGFAVGCTQQERITWDAESPGELACLCIPSVRNGHVTEEMLAFLGASTHALLNLNLYPTLAAPERTEVARQLLPLLQRSVLSISFSRGFGLTASQLGVALVHKDHPYRKRFETQWNWHTYFYNALAARAFMAVDLERMQAVDAQRRAWVGAWLAEHGLPAVESGSYYVKSFRVRGELPEHLAPLRRGDVVRLCFKPPQVG